MPTNESLSAQPFEQVNIAPTFYPRFLGKTRAKAKKLLAFKNQFVGVSDAQILAAGATHILQTSTGPSVAGQAFLLAKINRDSPVEAALTQAQMYQRGQDFAVAMNFNTDIYLTGEIEEDFANAGRSDYTALSNQFHKGYFDRCKQNRPSLTVNQTNFFGDYSGREGGAEVNDIINNPAKAAIFRNALSSQAQARKRYDPSTQLFTNQDEDYFLGNNYDFHNIQHKVYYENTQNSHGQLIPGHIFRIEKAAIGAPDREQAAFAWELIEDLNDVAVDGRGGYNYYIDSPKGVLYVGNNHKGAVPPYVALQLGFFFTFLTRGIVVWSDRVGIGNVQVAGNVRGLLFQAEGADEFASGAVKLWTPDGGSQVPYSSGSPGQPSATGGKQFSKYPLTALDAYEQGSWLADRAADYCNESIDWAEYSIDGGVTWVTPVSGSLGRKVSRPGVANLGGTNIVDVINSRRPIAMIGTGSAGKVCVFLHSFLLASEERNVKLRDADGVFDLGTLSGGTQYVRRYNKLPGGSAIVQPLALWYQPYGSAPNHTLAPTESQFPGPASGGWYLWLQGFGNIPFDYYSAEMWDYTSGPDVPIASQYLFNGPLSGGVSSTAAAPVFAVPYDSLNVPSLAGKIPVKIRVKVTGRIGGASGTIVGTREARFALGGTPPVNTAQGRHIILNATGSGFEGDAPFGIQPDVKARYDAFSSMTHEGNTFSGITAYRPVIKWSEYEPTPGVYKDAALRANIALCISRGHKFALCFWPYLNANDTRIPEAQKQTLNNGSVRIMPEVIGNSECAPACYGAAARSALTTTLTHLAGVLAEYREHILYVSFGLGDTEEYFSPALRGSNGHPIAISGYAPSELSEWAAFSGGQTAPRPDLNNMPWSIETMYTSTQVGRNWFRFRSKSLSDLHKHMEAPFKAQSLPTCGFFADTGAPSQSYWYVTSRDFKGIFNGVDLIYSSEGDGANPTQKLAATDLLTSNFQGKGAVIEYDSDDLGTGSAGNATPFGSPLPYANQRLTEYGGSFFKRGGKAISLAMAFAAPGQGGNPNGSIRDLAGGLWYLKQNFLDQDGPSIGATGSVTQSTQNFAGGQLYKSTWDAAGGSLTKRIDHQVTNWPIWSEST